MCPILYCNIKYHKNKKIDFQLTDFTKSDIIFLRKIGKYYISK